VRNQLPRIWPDSFFQKNQANCSALDWPLIIQSRLPPRLCVLCERLESLKWLTIAREGILTLLLTELHFGGVWFFKPEKVSKLRLISEFDYGVNSHSELPFPEIVHNELDILLNLL
jgi:hypothetical protein